MPGSNSLMSIHVKQIAPDFYQVTFPNGHTEILRNKDGYIHAGTKQFNDMKWVVKYLEKDYEANPKRYSVDRSEVTVDEITLEETPRGWTVCLRGRPMRCTIGKWANFDKKLPPGTFAVTSAAVSHGTVNGMENALALAATVCSGLIRFYGPGAYRDYVDPNEKIVEGVMLRLLGEAWDVKDAWHETALRAVGAWPLKILGSGFFGTTYMCEMDDGHRRAVKVTQGTSEPDGYDRIRKLMRKMPPNIAKHFPVIYDIQSVDTEQGTAYVIVMELLKPLPRDLADDMFETGVNVPRDDEDESADADPRPSRSFRHVYGDPENLIKAVNYGIDAYNSWVGRVAKNPMSNRTSIARAFPLITTSQRRTIERKCLSLSVDSRMAVRVSDIVFDTVKSHIGKIQDTSQERIDNAFRDQVERTMENAFSVAFPQGPGDIHPAGKTWIHNPVSRSLARALAFVTGNGVEWQDIHAGNVGLRPGTNDIVIFDLGLF